MAKLIRTYPGGEALFINERGDGLPEGVGGDPVEVECSADPPPLFADGRGVPQHACRGREDYIVDIRVRRNLAAHEHSQCEVRQGQRPGTGLGLCEAFATCRES